MFKVTDIPENTNEEFIPIPVLRTNNMVFTSENIDVFQIYKDVFTTTSLPETPGNQVTVIKQVFVPSSPVVVRQVHITPDSETSIFVRAGFSQPCSVSLYYHNKNAGSDTEIFLLNTNSTDCDNGITVPGLILDIGNTYILQFKIGQVRLPVDYGNEFTVRNIVSNLTLFSVSLTSITVSALFNFNAQNVDVYYNTSNTFTDSIFLGTLTTGQLNTGYMFNGLDLNGAQMYYVFFVYQYLLDIVKGNNSAITSLTISGVTLNYTNVGLYVYGVLNFTGNVQVYLNGSFLANASYQDLAQGKIFTNAQLIGGQTYTVTFKYTDGSDVQIITGTNSITIPYECVTVSISQVSAVSFTVDATFNFISTDVYVFLGNTNLGTQSTAQLFNGATFSGLSLSAGQYQVSFRYPTSGDTMTLLSGNPTVTVPNQIFSITSITSNTVSITVTGTPNYNGSVTVSCNGGVGTLGTITTAQLISGHTFSGLNLTGGQVYTLGFSVSVLSGSLTTTCPNEITDIQSITIDNTSITVQATTNFSGSVLVSYNTTNTPSGATTLGTITKAQLSSGYTFTGLTLTGGQTYYLFFNNGITVLSGSNSVTLPQYINTIQSITANTTSITVQATTNFSGSVLVSYNTTNTPSGATTLGTITKAQLSSGYTFTGLTLTGGQTYYLFFNNGITVLSGSNSVISIPNATGVSVSLLYDTITVTATTDGNVTYSILYNSVNDVGTATSLGNATQSELLSGKSFGGLSLNPTTLYYTFILFSGFLINTSSGTSPAPTVTSVTPTFTYNSITVSGTADYSVTYSVYYNTTNSMTGATSLGTATKAELSGAGKTFSGLTLLPSTLYYVIIQYSSSTVGSGSTTSPAPTVTSVTPTSTYNSITVSGTADYSVTYSVYYNTTNSMTGATSLGTATKAELSGAGKTFSGLTLLPSTLYYVIIQYSSSTVGSGSTTSPAPTVTSVTATSTYNSMTVNGIADYSNTYSVYYNTVNDIAGATLLGTATKAELSGAGKTFSGLTLLPSTLYYVIIQFSSNTVGIGNTTSPAPTVTSVTPSSTYNSITVSGTADYSVTYNVYYGATLLGTATKAELSGAGKTFSGLTLSPSTLYNITIQYSSSTVGSGSTTSPAPTVTSVTATSTYNSITVSGTADYSTTYSLYYNTVNDIAGATLIGTATKAELSGLGKTFSGLTLSPSTLYYIIIQYSSSTVGSGSTTSPAPTVTSVTATSTYNSITVSGTADYSTTYSLYYNTVNDIAGATLIGTATKAELSGLGKTFSGLTLSPSTLYYIIIQYSSSTVGSGSTTSPAPTVTGYSATELRYNQLQLGMTIDYDVTYTVNFDIVGGGASTDIGTVTKAQLATGTFIVNIQTLQSYQNYYVYLKYNGVRVYTSPTEIFTPAPFGYFLTSVSRVLSTRSGTGYFTICGEYNAATNIQTQANITYRSLSAPTSNTGIVVKVTSPEMDITDTLTVTSSGYSEVRNSSLNSSGTMVVCGIYNGSGSIMRDSTTITSLPSGSNTTLGYVTVVDSSNNHVFTRCIDAQSIVVNDVTIDSGGNVYVVGSYTNVMRIRDESGTLLATGYTKSGSNGRAGYVIKFNAAGAYQYMRATDNLFQYTEVLNSVKCDSTGNVYVCGNSLLDPGIFTEDGTQLARIFLGKTSSANHGIAIGFQPDGTLINAYVLFYDSVGSDTCSFKCIDIDSSNNVYIGGQKNVNAVKLRNKDGGDTSLMSAVENANGILVAFTPSFGVSWARAFGGSSTFVSSTVYSISYPYVMCRYGTSSVSIGAYNESNTLLSSFSVPNFGRWGALLKFSQTGTMNSSYVIYSTMRLQAPIATDSSSMISYNGYGIYSVCGGGLIGSVNPISTYYTGTLRDSINFIGGGTGLCSAVCAFDVF